MFSAYCAVKSNLQRNNTGNNSPGNIYTDMASFLSPIHQISRRIVESLLLNCCLCRAALHYKYGITLRTSSFSFYFATSSTKKDEMVYHEFCFVLFNML